jgi:N-acetyl-1-D-myo-inositol-2-amino-2-deoxy-alpha-D-glucopyranoside deacetylase
MAEELTLMAVHAHPDDEAISTGGVLARYADEGLRTVLVTCTGGEVGEIGDSVLATPETLAEVRRRELERACEILRVGRLHVLGYRDSGMMGTPDNEHPSSFYQAPLEEATARLVALVRRDRPQVLVTYDERGFYGHPDHIRAHQITMAAFDAAGDPARWPEAGPPWQPAKLYYTAVARSAIRRFGRLMREAGIEMPFEDGEAGEAEIGTADELITAQIDVSAHVERKRQALMAHASQMGPEVFFAKMPPALFHQVFGRESYQLVRGPAGAPGIEDDLFAGLRTIGSTPSSRR